MNRRIEQFFLGAFVGVGIYDVVECILSEIGIYLRLSC